MLLGSDVLAQLGKISIDYNESPPVFSFVHNQVEDQMISFQIASEKGISVPPMSLIFVSVSNVCIPHKNENTIFLSLIRSYFQIKVCVLVKQLSIQARRCCQLRIFLSPLSG